MEDTIVEFEVAKLAKEKGFTVKCLNKFYDLAGEMQMQYGSGKYWMDEEGEEWQPEILGCTHTGIGERTITNTYERPTQSLLAKWLREEHHLIVIVAYQYEHDSTPYSYWIYKENNSLPLNQWINDLKTYEEALEKGLQEALKLI